MRANLFLSASAVSCAILFSSLAVVARQQGTSQQTGDPVADAARRARESKQNAPKPRKVYTDDDVSKPKPAPATASSTTQDSTAQAGGASANTPAPADQDAKTEAAWRQRFKEQRDKIS